MNEEEEEEEEEKAMVEAARTEASKVQEPFMVRMMSKSDEGRRISGRRSGRRI